MLPSEAVMCTELVPRALALAVLSLAAACGNESGGGERDVRVEDAPPDTRDATVDTIETTIGEAPTITVTSPREGEVVPAGVVVLEAAVADPDSALASLEVTWESSLDGALGVARPTATGLARLTIDTLTIGAHEITATVRDEGGRSAAMTVAMIVNGAPAIPVVTLSPEAPTTADTLVATLAPLVDPNREPSALTVTWVWLADGVAQVGLDGPMVPPDRTSRGQVWQVRVTIDDGHGATATGDASVTIVNAAPLCVSATLAPAEATTTTTLTCTCAGREDVDGDAAMDRCTFYDRGEVLAEIVADEDGTCVLDPELTARGMDVACAFAPGDGEAVGPSAVTTTVTIANTLPTVDVPIVSPSSTPVGGTFTCSVVGWSDPDPADATPTVDFQWLRRTEGGDVPIDGATADTLVTTGLARGDQVVCRVTPKNEGALGQARTSAAVTVTNRPPTTPIVAVSALEGADG
ncbi:MAG: hypothetical protein IT385_26490, partial [Deltaproteobacteria bacterium]|nr:hypothetical protein [Deltaproteobacteria bacterium]